MSDPEKPRRRARAVEPESEAPSSGAPAKKRRAAPLAALPLAKLPRPTLPLSTLEERAPRQTLLLGGALLLIGLALVGTGAEMSGVGAVVALAGLVAIIYGIHAFGRLGPEDATPDTLDAVARSSAEVQRVLGVLIAVVGLAVGYAAFRGVAPPGSLQTAVIAFVGGGFWALRAAMKLSEAKKARDAA